MENNIDLNTLEAGDKVKLRCGGVLLVRDLIRYPSGDVDLFAAGYIDQTGYGNDGNVITRKPPHPLDIIEIIKAPKPIEVECWVNVYQVGHCWRYHPTRESADKCAEEHRIACKHVKFSYVEGEGL